MRERWDLLLEALDEARADWDFERVEALERMIADLDWSEMED